MPTKLDDTVLDESQFAIVEWEPELQIPEDEVIELSSGKRVLPFRKLQRIVGAIQGTILSYNEEEGGGRIRVEDTEFPYSDTQEDHHSRRLFSDLATSGETNGFSFWPTHTESGNPIPQTVKSLQISWIWTNPIEISGYVDTFGQLLQIGRHGFRVGIMSPATRSRYYVDFAGEYPYPDEEGDYVFVRGRFHPGSGNIQFESTESVALARGDDRREARQKSGQSDRLS